LWSVASEDLAVDISNGINLQLNPQQP